MCIDYSALSIISVLDGYPLPNMQESVNKIAQYRHFSTLDLSAYHQIELPVEDRPYTAFEANGKLCQSKRLFRLDKCGSLVPKNRGRYY